MLSENNKILAIVRKKDSKSYTVRCENSKEYTIKFKENYLYESIDELYRSGSLFYFNPYTKEIYFSTEDTYLYEDYEIPDERDDLVE